MSDAERQKRRRERKRQGVMRVTLDVPREVRDVLVETRWLGEWDEDDKPEVQAVLQMMLNNLRPGVTRDG